MEDAAIIELYWARDQLAIVESDRKYGGFCANLASNILRSVQDAEECVNDTWHRAWNTMPPQRPGSLRAYLGRIVRNLAIDRWRRKNTQRRGGGLEVMLSELEGCLPGGQDAQQELENREITRAIEDWLDGLEAGDRAMFLRRYWYGEGVGELARRWGRSSSAVTRRLGRLRESLRGFLEERGVAL